MVVVLVGELGTMAVVDLGGECGLFCGDARIPLAKWFHSVSNTSYHGPPLTNDTLVGLDRIATPAAGAWGRRRSRVRWDIRF
jgi:hypothetical protein